jgi:hypothetical protein
MAKGKMNRKRPKKGPYLSVAAFCESVIESKDGALTPVRIIDQITVSIPPDAPPDFPSESNKFPVGVACIISFKSGDSPGEHSLRVIAESPSGKSLVAYDEVVVFSEPPQGGINVRMNQFIAVIKGGLFWLHIYLDGRHVTSMPLLITVVRDEVKPLDPGAKQESDGVAKKRRRRKA